MLLQAYWGSPTVPGSLCNLRDHIHRGLVDKAGKTFNIADEFVTHSVRAHMIAAICSHLGMSTPTDLLVHECSREWLESTAKSFVRSKVLPSESKDPVYGLHRSFLYTGFMYIDLRNAIRLEEGQHIIRLWKHWSVLFLALNKSNYSKEAMNLLANINASYPKWLAYIVTHNRTVNTHGKAGHGKPIDQMLEHYNL